MAAMLSPRLGGVALMVLLTGCRHGAGDEQQPGDDDASVPDGGGGGEPAPPARALPCQLPGMPFADDGATPAVTGTAPSIGSGRAYALAPDGSLVILRSQRLYEVRPPATTEREIGEVPVPDFQVYNLAATATDVYTVTRERVEFNSYRVRRFPRAGGPAEPLWLGGSDGSPVVRVRGSTAFVAFQFRQQLSIVAFEGGTAKEVLKMTASIGTFAVDREALYVPMATEARDRMRVLVVDRTTAGRVEFEAPVRNLWNLAADEGFLYYSELPDAAAPLYPPPTIRRVRRDGTCAAQLVTGGLELVVAAGRLVWRSRNSHPNDMGVGEMLSRYAALDLVTGRVVIPFQEAAYAGPFVFDGTHIYSATANGLKRIAVSF